MLPTIKLECKVEDIFYFSFGEEILQSIVCTHLNPADISVHVNTCLKRLFANNILIDISGLKQFQFGSS